MPRKEEGLEDLFVEELQDMLDTERQLVHAIPQMAKAASDERLAAALREHLEATKGHVERLARVFQTLDRRAIGRASQGMQGILEDLRRTLELEKGQPVMDTAIAGAARRIEHFEIAGYENVSAMARQLGMNDAAGILEQTLHEEVEADRKLAEIGTRVASQAPVAAAR
jgi:ferritin-like metal-binding protein YciE